MDAELVESKLSQQSMKDKMSLERGSKTEKCIMIASLYLSSSSSMIKPSDLKSDQNPTTQSKQ